MALKVHVLDIGSYSAKRIIARAPLVGFGVGSAREEVHASALEPRTRRADQTRSARELLPEKKLAGEAVAALLPMEGVLHRVLDLPFTDRSKLSAVLPLELEAHVPLAAEDLVFDYVTLERSSKSARLFVSVMSRKDQEELREWMESLHIDPRVLAEEAVSNARLFSLLSDRPEGKVAFVDVGHRKTVVTVVENGKLLGCRVAMFGGFDLTRRISERHSLSLEEAQKVKHEAHLYPAGEGLAVGRLQDVADELQEGLSTLVRDLNQAFRQFGPVDSVWLFGGSARLQGLHSFLSDRLGVPVQVLVPSLLKMTLDSTADSPEMVACIAAANSALRGGDEGRINFRTGGYAYEGDFRYVRGRLFYLLFAMLVMVGFFLVPAHIRHSALLEQKLALDDELTALSEQIFGETLEDYEEIVSRLDEVPPAAVWTVFPDLSAHEIFWEVMDVVSRVDGLPTGETIMPTEEAPGTPAVEVGLPGTEGLDPLAAAGGLEGLEGVDGTVAPALTQPQEAIHRIEMNSMRVDSESRATSGDGSVEFTGNASSVATMELFLERMSQHVCFHNVQKTKQEILKATTGREGWWRFTVEFTVSCPRKSVEELRKDRAEKEDEAETPADPKSKDSALDKGKTEGETGTRSEPPKAEEKKAGKGAVVPKKEPASDNKKGAGEAEKVEPKAVPDAKVRDKREPATTGRPERKAAPAESGTRDDLLPKALRARSDEVKRGVMEKGAEGERVPVGAGVVPRRSFLNTSPAKGSKDLRGTRQNLPLLKQTGKVREAPAVGLPEESE